MLGPLVLEVCRCDTFAHSSFAWATVSRMRAAGRGASRIVFRPPPITFRTSRRGGVCRPVMTSRGTTARGTRSPLYNK